MTGLQKESWWLLREELKTTMDKEERAELSTWLQKHIPRKFINPNSEYSKALLEQETEYTRLVEISDPTKEDIDSILTIYDSLKRNGKLSTFPTNIPAHLLVPKAPQVDWTELTEGKFKKLTSSATPLPLTPSQISRSRGGKISVDEALRLRAPHHADDPAVVKHLIEEATKGLRRLGIKRGISKGIEKSFKKAIANLRVHYETSKIPSMRALLARTLALGPDLL